MKFNHKHEKTTFLPIGGQVVQVRDLPQELQNEVETLDRLIQDKTDSVYELEKIELAVMVKAQQIETLVTGYLNQAKEQQAAKDNANAEVSKQIAQLDPVPATKKAVTPISKGRKK